VCVELGFALAPDAPPSRCTCLIRLIRFCASANLTLHIPIRLGPSSNNNPTLQLPFFLVVGEPICDEWSLNWNSHWHPTPRFRLQTFRDA
jgi:hypothetical protein